MANADHAGYKKIQCWIPQATWDIIESLGYPNQTNAVTDAFDLLINKSQDNPNTSHNIPELKAQIEGLQLLLEEKNQRIEDLRKDKETLSIFAHYFKSLEYKRLEASTEEIKADVQETEERPARNPREVHREKGNKEQEIKADIKETEEKPARSPREVHRKKGNKELIEKICKNCNQTFETSNPKKETCSSKCRTAFNRRKNN